jgi:hypothetical protein
MAFSTRGPARPAANGLEAALRARARRAKVDAGIKEGIGDDTPDLVEPSSTI